MIPLAYPLKEVIYNHNARGHWCALPYPGHPKGCPNLVKGCTFKRPNFNLIRDSYHWYAVMEEFDLLSHAKKMKEKHIDWTDRQCHNPLYWQGSVRKKLRENAQCVANTSPQSIILDIPEACGVEVFETIARVGIILEKTPDIVRKIMLVGIPK
jgi:hypothetical protein